MRRPLNLLRPLRTGGGSAGGGVGGGAHNDLTGRSASNAHPQSAITGLTAALQALADDVALRALIASPALTGTPTAPTAAQGTNTTQLATTAFVRTEVAALADSAPGTLDTLNELAAALGDDPNFATTVTNLIAGIDTRVDALEAFDAALPSIVADPAQARIVVDSVTEPTEIRISVDLAVGLSGGSSIIGGNNASEILTVGSTSHATRGFIYLRDRVNLLTEDLTSPGYTLRGINIDSARTFTFGDATAGRNTLQAFISQANLVYSATSATFAAQLFVDANTLKNDQGNARTINSANTIAAIPTLQANGATQTFGGHTGLYYLPTTEIANAGTGTITALTAVRAGATVGTSTTVTTRRGLWFLDATGSGTIAANIGVDIEFQNITTPTISGANIGIRNASTTVYTPPAAQAITAVGNTIVVTSTVMEITANGSYTLTSAPTIADGQNGQVVTIVNADTGSDVVTLQDQGTLASSNLRLVGTSCALGPRDSITLLFLSSVGDWVEIARSNVT
jgi:hypothetical protein